MKVVGIRGLCLVLACWERENAHLPLGELCSDMTSAGQAVGEAVARGWCIGKTVAFSRMDDIYLLQGWTPGLRLQREYIGCNHKREHFL